MYRRHGHFLRGNDGIYGVVVAGAVARVVGDELRELLVVRVLGDEPFRVVVRVDAEISRQGCSGQVKGLVRYRV